MEQTRNRSLYAVVIAVVIVLGLTSRSDFAVHLPDFIATYAGDTLWALTVFLGLGFVFNRAPTITLALSALLISYGVELSQLYQAEWFNALRDTRIGALLLGSGFKGSDFICYTLGITAGAFGDWLRSRRFTYQVPKAD